MAPFNKRQIGYIQAIAGRQQHVSLMAGQHDVQIGSSDSIHASLVPQTLRLVSGTNTSGPSSADEAKSLLLYSWLLDEPELGFDARAVHNNAKLESDDFADLSQTDKGMGNYKTLHVFDCACKPVTYSTNALVPGNAHEISDVSVNKLAEAYVPSTTRATPDGFLNSTTVRFRFTLPSRYTDRAINSDGNEGIHTTHPMGQDHYEFRWIVWRSKRPTYSDGADGTITHDNLDAIRDGKSFRNPGYDLFKGQTGRKRGFLGYTHHPEMDEHFDTKNPPSERYSGKYMKAATSTDTFLTGPTATSTQVDLSRTYPVTEENMTVDDLLTMPLNKDDYVVMKDVRFFLGKEHGKSHFEDNLHWDWNDPIDTPHVNVLTSPTLNTKNYRWHMTLIGTSGGQGPTVLNASVRWTTKMESG